MQIAIINWTRRKVGGVEVYLDNIIPHLIEHGHRLAFFYDTDEPNSTEKIRFPENVLAISKTELGDESALKKLQDWCPDLIYSHGLRNPVLEAATIKLAPAVFFAHDYSNTCISGAKSYKFPVVTPCHRRFGWQCLLHYYPHRCGGLNPLTMLKEYRKQSEHLKFLHNYQQIITFSEYMRREYASHNLPTIQVYKFPIQNGNVGKEGLAGYDDCEPIATGQPDKKSPYQSPACRKLLFLGRMDLLKGGNILIDALPQVKKSLNCTLQVTFAGDGVFFNKWQQQAKQLTANFADIKIDFVGWVNSEQRQELLSNNDLLVVPSLWPEPFGLVGLEAVQHQLPIAAFAVGGIPEWLEDGLNGYLAAGNPPTSAGLAQAIIKSLSDPDNYARLKKGTQIIANKFEMKNHLAALLEIFEKVVKR